MPSPRNENMTSPEISVVVPVLNGADALPSLLGALAGQTVAQSRFEVVIVDNGSADESADVARGFGARVVVEAPKGHGRARNRGLAAARADQIAFTDADCVPDPDWLEALLSCLQNAALVAGRVDLEVTGEPNRWERLDRLWRFRDDRRADQGWAPTANLGLRREVIGAAGRFDPLFGCGGEDVDFCLRARAAGYDLAECTGAVVRHKASVGRNETLRRAFIQGYSSNQHAYRWPGVIGLRHWRHPRPALFGEHALGRFGASRADNPDLLWPARAEYGFRVLGSTWAELRRAR